MARLVSLISGTGCVVAPDLRMWVVPAWVEAHCVIPDQDKRGEPFLLGEAQATFMLNHYDVKASAAPGMKGDAFRFRRSQLVRSQKWGKSPLVAAFVCVEAVGPVLFDGWAAGGELYRCSEHGCGCGWVYEYMPGEPMGREWTTPRIQITATSEDQTANTYDALRPMIALGPLQDLIPKAGEEFIRLPNDGLIEAVSSKATSRIGARVSFVPQDETGLWLKSNGGHKLAWAQRRGLAGMGGRAIETTNAWDPSENSVAQQSFGSNAPDIQRDFRQAPADLSFRNKRERRKILEFNYAESPWVPIDLVEAEAVELMEQNPANAERFFGNRLVQGDGAWMDVADWKSKGEARPIPYGSRVTLGFDGSDNNDWTTIRLETLDMYQFTPTYMVGGEERPARWQPEQWGGKIPRLEVDAAIEQIVAKFDVVRAYCDPKFWETDIDRWASMHGDRVFVKWDTSAPKKIHEALERMHVDVASPESQFRHDDDPVTEQHFANAVKRARPGERYIIGKHSEHQKIDDAMSSTLAHEAACDAIAAGENRAAVEEYVYY